MPQKKFPFGEKNLQDLLLLGANDEYKTDLDKLYKKYGISDSQEIDGKESLEFMQDPRLMEFYKESTELIFKHNISTTFGLVISFLTEKGHITKAASGEKIKVDAKEIAEYLISSSGIKMTDKGKDYYTLRVYADTTGKDVQADWKRIQDLFGKKTGRKKISKNLMRDLEINKLKEQGKTATEITREINKKYKNKVAYQDISKNNQRLKTKASKNMPDKDS